MSRRNACIRVRTFPNTYLTISFRFYQVEGGTELRRFLPSSEGESA